MNGERIYLAIDLKSFYASVECIERGLNPMNTHLVVADESRTEKTICLAVTPSLKAIGVPGRPRLFEAIQKVETANEQRQYRAPGHTFTGSSYFADELKAHPEWKIDFLKAPPRMAAYIDYSTRIYDIYLRHVAPEDIHVYSIDEVFMDITGYLKAARKTPRQFASAIISEVLAETGITATAGIGSNLYLCKIALDIMAKHVEPDENGVRIAMLNETSYRRLLWDHRPLTDFWRVGGGYARKLEQYGLYTMGDIARCSLGKPGTRHSEELLYQLFGVNAELLIDHAWGWEPCTMADIKAYQPASSSLGAGQVLHCPYDFDKARLIVQEMMEQLALDLLEKGLVTDQVALTIGYEHLTGQALKEFRGSLSTDPYGRQIPKHAGGSANLPFPTSSARLMVNAALELYDRMTDPQLLIRRVNVVATHTSREQDTPVRPAMEQLDLFTDYAQEIQRRQAEQRLLMQERNCQKAVLEIRRRFGKNAILRGMNLQDGATAMDRNRQIGGHKA